MRCEPQWPKIAKSFSLLADMLGHKYVLIRFKYENDLCELPITIDLQMFKTISILGKMSSRFRFVYSTTHLVQYLPKDRH